MRLRSSQFVFLLLLVCSAQIHGDSASQLLSAAMQAQSAAVSTSSEDGSAIASPLRHSAADFTPSSATLRLDSAALAAHRIAWTMRRPASHSAAITSFTGFLRA
jgi:hypothetical protein